MKTFKQILFPVDLSETSPKIVPYVKLMSKKFDARVHLLFVARIFQHFTGTYVPHVSINQFEAELIQGAEKRLHEFKEEFFDGFKNTVVKVIPGDISEEILSYCDTENIDMLIMGTHGRKGMDKILFGSVADRITKMATVPVFLINPFKVSPLLQDEDIA
ncbi:MAG: universal stress protein [Desulfobacterales bacterium]|nr:universal stress protein [Desulfobacterales bacterium]